VKLDGRQHAKVLPTFVMTLVTDGQAATPYPRPTRDMKRHAFYCGEFVIVVGLNESTVMRCDRISLCHCATCALSPEIA
jgi:hypothetical protein